MPERLLSVGIDIGTSTTSAAASSLSVENTAPHFTVPRVAITGAEVIYRGEIYRTPISGDGLLDAAALASIIRGEYRRAGIEPEAVDTGAVIVTGESSRRRNAEIAASALSDMAGDFVVATAGPDLESVIAGKGSGARDLSEERGTAVINLDIGGGTTNIALFSAGETAGVGCLDVGGRLITEERGVITYISPRAEPVCRDAGVSIAVGDRVDEAALRRVTDRMAGLICEACGLAPRTELYEAVATVGASRFGVPSRVDAVSFSGGVADMIYGAGTEPFAFGDIGSMLADSVRRSRMFGGTFEVVRPRETIRATVIGAGSHTATVSGSTIDCVSAALPLKNLPAFVPSRAAELAAADGDGSALASEASRFAEDGAASGSFAFCLTHVKQPSYAQVGALALAIVEASAALPRCAPLVVLTAGDFSKALGQAIRRRIGARNVLCADGIAAREGDYLDFGSPIAGGTAVTAVVKTLVFG